MPRMTARSFIRSSSQIRGMRDFNREREMARQRQHELTLQREQDDAAYKQTALEGRNQLSAERIRKSAGGVDWVNRWTTLDQEKQRNATDIARQRLANAGELENVRAKGDVEMAVADLQNRFKGAESSKDRAQFLTELLTKDTLARDKMQGEQQFTTVKDPTAPGGERAVAVPKYDNSRSAPQDPEARLKLLRYLLASI
ncbi:hypothetical protein [Oceanidesulfovibrio marinus]|uniref:Uncharacterized protein n=1 Tax=Oceanidesulfovibrio marinus TaxID=370038 RepID=A0A6P1ZD29_9BACT|nr:hypothetical protein [Oceanidesulfovibrio marinus]TVM31156.1 hypothetical protein DQK91_18775 [Oceanidesulfovibrio marinus]